MVLGTQDRFLTGRQLASFCEERGIRYCLVDGVNHSLKDDTDAERTCVSSTKSRLSATDFIPE